MIGTPVNDHADRVTPYDVDAFLRSQELGHKARTYAFWTGFLVGTGAVLAALLLWKVMA